MKDDEEPGPSLAQALRAASAANNKEGIVNDYAGFLGTKEQRATAVGFDSLPLPRGLYPFQEHAVKWAVRIGRCALFEDCGLGKGRQSVEWARQIAEHTGRPVLILCPLAVASQIIREGAAIGVAVKYAKTPADMGDARIVVTNYERLEAWVDAVPRFAGVVADESSILKAFSGATKQLLVSTFSRTPYRLACTATPAPNDYLELGNQAEFLGIMSSHEMIARWFLPDTSTFGVYRLKGHAVEAFWDWVASWAICIGTPADIGYDDRGYVLPEMRTHKHVVGVNITADRGDALFRIPELSATTVHKERRLTATARAERVAEIVIAEPAEHWIVWCDTNYEEEALSAVMPAARVVRGSHSLEAKEAAADWFSGYAGDAEPGVGRILISKASIFGWGLNWQHCARAAFVGATFSYESFYQAVRRIWRFGQARPVDIHCVVGATELGVLGVMTQKQTAHERMKVEMFAAMRRAQAKVQLQDGYQPGRLATIPKWLRSETRVTQ